MTKRRIIVIALILMVLLGVGGGIAFLIHRNKPEKVLIRAKMALRMKEYAKAVDYAMTYRAKRPQDWMGYYVQAEAYMGLAEYPKAREPLKKALEFEPQRINLHLALADTYARPARRALATDTKGWPAEDIRKHIDAIREGNTTLTGVRIEPAADASPEEREQARIGQLDLVQYLGINEINMGLGYQLMEERYKADAERAEQSNLADLKKNSEAGAKEAAKFAEQFTQSGMDKLLQVVTKDPARSRPGVMLLELAQQRSNTEVIEKVRAALKTLDNPPPAPTRMLIVHDLRSRIKEADPTEMRPQFRDSARELDKLLENYKKERDRLTPDEQHVQDQEMDQIRIVRGELALLLGELPLAEKLAQEVLQHDSRRAQARIIEAIVLVQRGQPIEAERKLYSLVTDFPRWARAQFHYANVALQVGKETMALDALRKVVALDPNHIQARKMLVQLSARTGAQDQAVGDARIAYEKNPADPDAVRLYVASLAMKGEKTTAKDILVVAEKDHGKSPGMLLALVEGYAQLDMKDEAARLAKILVESKPETPADRIAVARALLASGQVSRAEKMLLDEYKRDPSSAAVAFELGKVYTLSKRTLQSLEYFRKALAASTGNTIYRLALAQALFETGDLEEAGQVVESVEPTNAVGNMLRMQIALLQGKELDSAQLLKAIGEGKQSGLPLAVLYLRTARPKQCIEICQTELKKKPNDVNTLGVLAQAQAVMGDSVNAVKNFKLVLKAAPSRLATYLQLASVLAQEKAPAAVATELNAVENAEKDLVELTLGWLFTRLNKPDEARIVYERLAENAEAPQDSRQRGRLLLTKSLADAGRIEDALKQVDLLGSDEKWKKPAQDAKVSLLVAAKRFKDAEKVLQDMRKAALDEKNSVALGRLVKPYVQIEKQDEALAVCDQMLSIHPDSAQPYLLRAEIYKLQNKAEEVIKAYYKAIELQPGNFSTYETLARVLDAFNRPQAALDVLDRLEKVSQSGQMVALFERGTMFARWGLRTQAAENLEKLAQQDVSANPKLQYDIARLLAQVGKKDQARAVLVKIQEYSQLHLPAQVLLADIAPDTNAALTIIRKYAPQATQQALVHEMSLLMRDKRYQEVVSVFRAFQKANPLVSDQAAGIAVQALAQLGTRSDAAQICQQMAARPQAQPMWRQLAALLTVDTNIDEAAKSLPAPAVATIYDALVGIALAAQKGDVQAGRTWHSIIGPIEQELAKRNPPTVLAGRLKVLAALASGVTGQASTELNNARIADPSELAVAKELVGQATSNPKAMAEAGVLLKAALANEWGLSTLSRAWAMDVLKARPTCQWAADQVIRTGADLQVRREVLGVLQPNNCLLALGINASILTEEKQYEKAAQTLAAAAKVAGDAPGMLVQVAMATERAGRLKDASDLYTALYRQTKNPIAANNGAYLITLLYPNDVEKLAEAQKWMEEAVEKAPNVPAFHDTLGWIAFRRGEKANAMTHLWTGVKGSPASPENHFHLGLAEIDAGNKQIGAWHLGATVEIGQQMKADGVDIPASTLEAIRMATQELEKLKQS